MSLILAFLWGIVARLRNIRQFPQAVLVAWTDPRYATDRILLSIQMVWVVWLANPLFDTFGAAAGYRKMSEIMREEWWALLLLVLTTIHVDAMIHNNPNVRRNAALLEMGAWIFIAWMFAISNIMGLGFPIYAVVAWHFYRIYRRRV